MACNSIIKIYRRDLRLLVLNAVVDYPRMTFEA